MTTTIREQSRTGVVGQSVARSDGEAKVSGEAVYGVDYAEAGMLYAKLLRSPVPAGSIRRLDTTVAATMPGVRGVFTAADAPPLLGGLVIKDQPLFASDVVRFEGEPIAGVVAETEHEAAAAVAAIELELDPIAAVSDVEAAIEEGARLVHPDWRTHELNVPTDYPRYDNVATQLVSDPDPEAFEHAFASATSVVEGEYRAARQYQAYLEPKAAVARYAAGRYIVNSASQFPFNVRDRVAQFLGVRPSSVRVVGNHVGGAFGAKLDAGLEPYAALFARLTGRPVKIVNERLEDMLTCPSRENAIVRLRTALGADGTILARELTCLMDNGAYSGEMPWLASLPMHVLGQVYKPGVTRLTCKLVYTNTAPTGAFRGVGGTYLYFALERHMDECARALGIDRREFRLKNLIGEGAESLTGQVLESPEILREAFETMDRIAPWAEAGRKGANGKLRGVGIAAVTWLTNPMPGSVTMKLNEDGTVGLITAANENGSGAVAMGITQIAAEALGVRPEDVLVTMPDTDVAGYDGGSQGSRTTHIVGRAATIAAAEVREKIFAVASELLEAAESDLELVDGEVRVKGASTGLPLAQVATTATFTGGSITGTGSYATAVPSYDAGSASGLLFPVFPTPTYHVHLAEVEVDPVMGQIEVTRYVVVQEVGKAINPTGIRGQIQGGVAQGLGYALYENLQIVEGRYQQRTLEAYRLPLSVDVPNVEFVLLEHPEPNGPYGARGVGEPPVIPVAAVVGNAVADAIGKPINRVPITPDDVLAALAGETV
jgi:CO/xanthine dehydrogenase Mo-binding subunit